MGWDDGRRKRSSRTHPGPRATRGIGRVARSSSTARVDAVEGEGGERRPRCCIFTFVFAGRSDNTYLVLRASSSMRYRRRRRPRRFLLGSVNDSRHCRRRARGSRARCPPASSTEAELGGDVDVLSPAGLDALKTRLGARPRPSPSVFETLRGSSAPRTAPAHLFRAPSLAPIPPEHDDWRARADGMRAATAALEPPAPDPDAHPASSAATADDAALDDLVRPPTRPF